MSNLEVQLGAGIEAFEKGDRAGAIRIYSDLLAIREDWSQLHYNLGLVYKYGGEWALSFVHNQRAIELQPRDEAGWWNLGIAATALGNWRVARRAWNEFGLKYDESDEPPDGDIGISPVRINTADSQEVVWGQRIDPARILVQNIPLPESGRRFGEIVLHDGAPNGTRTYGGVEYSVFDELELYRPSRHRTYALECRLNDPADFERLADVCLDADFGIENWSTSVRMLCEACSTGTPHEHDDVSPPPDESRIGLAADDLGGLWRIVTDWSRAANIKILRMTDVELKNDLTPPQ